MTILRAEFLITRVARPALLAYTLLGNAETVIAILKAALQTAVAVEVRLVALALSCSPRAGGQAHTMAGAIPSALRSRAVIPAKPRKARASAILLAFATSSAIIQALLPITVGAYVALFTGAHAVVAGAVHVAGGLALLVLTAHTIVHFVTKASAVQAAAMSAAGCGTQLLGAVQPGEARAAAALSVHSTQAIPAAAIQTHWETTVFALKTRPANALVYHTVAVYTAYPTSFRTAVWAGKSQITRTRVVYTLPMPRASI